MNCRDWDRLPAGRGVGLAPAVNAKRCGQLGDFLKAHCALAEGLLIGVQALLVVVVVHAISVLNEAEGGVAIGSGQV